MKKIVLCSALLCATIGFGMREKKDRLAHWSKKEVDFFQKKLGLNSKEELEYFFELSDKLWKVKQRNVTLKAVLRSDYKTLKKQPTKSFVYKKNDASILKVVLSRKDMTLRNICMYKLLIHACEVGDLSRVKKLFSMFPEVDLNYCVDENRTGHGVLWYGQTLVTTAAQNGYNNIITFLVSKGADPNLPSAKDFTPVYYAASNGHLETLKLLIDTYKCNPNIPDYIGYIPLTQAVSNGHVEVVKYLLDHPRIDLYLPRLNVENKKQTIHELMCIAARRGRLEMLKYLMDRYNYDVNNIMGGCNNTSEPILWVASTWNQTSICNYLLGKGANVHLADDNGNTLLHHAAREGNLESVKLFISCHLRPDVKNDMNALPLHYACWWGNLKVVKYLVDECKCNPFAKDDDGKTPFDYARKPEIIKYFNALIKEKV